MSAQPIDLSREANQALQPTTSPPKCPGCHAALNFILYTERGRMVWDGQTWWQEDKAFGDIEFFCPDCDLPLDYDFLQQIGLA